MRGTCYNCQMEMETRDHIFFGCSYAKDIWKQVLQLCGLSREVKIWSEELAWAIQRIKGKVLISMVLKMAWKAFIYFVWCEMNKRMHNGLSETTQQLLNKIKNVVCIKLDGLTKIARDDINRLICSNWGLSVEMIV